MRFFDYSEWSEKYTQLKNPQAILKKFGGSLYQTYGADFNNVALYDSDKVWAWVELPIGRMIVNGFRPNAKGYFLTEKPWRDEETDTDLIVVFITEEDING